jgi:hypothetical protein
VANLQHKIFSHQVLTQIASANNHVVDASTEGVGWVFQPFNADPITHIGFRFGARTGTPPTYQIELETVDGTGLPTGTDVGGVSPTLATFTPPASTAWDGTWQWIALTNSHTPTRGQVIAAVIRYSSGTIDGSNNASFTRNLANHGFITGFPYCLTNSAGTWSKIATGPTFGWRTASGRYGWIGTLAYATASANTAGHRILAKFKLPSGEASSYKVIGMAGQFKPGAGSGSCKMILTDSSGTILQETTFDSDQDANVNAVGGRLMYFDDTSLQDLTYGTDYYIGLEVISGTVTIGGISLAEAADRESYPNGLNRCLGTATGGAITDNTLVMPAIEIIVDEITPASGSGGGALILGGLGQTGIGSF